jgi:NADH:ubiquinone oxidoreductase subunit E/CheY-like chemotaxis protein
MFLDEVATAGPTARRDSLTDVLVIDDERSMCDGCRQTLEAEGLRAVTAPDGPRGVELVEQTHPRVIVVDLKMPGMSGMEVLAKVSEIDPTIVSIVITGYASIESVKRGMELSETRQKARPPARAAPPEAAALDAPQVALRGLEVLGQYYSLGLNRRDFLDELKNLEAESRFHAETLGRIREKEKVVLQVVEDLRVVDEIVTRHEYRKSALLQILLDVQSELNWLPRHALKWISRRLKVSLASIYTIASFYEALSLEPRGEHLVEICTGTACHVRGAPRLQASASALLGIEPGQTDPDQVFTLKTVHCMGCCALAPVVKIDDRYYSNPSLRELRKVFDSYRQKKEQPCLR